MRFSAYEKLLSTHCLNSWSFQVHIAVSACLRVWRVLRPAEKPLSTLPDIHHLLLLGRQWPTSASRQCPAWWLINQPVTILKSCQKNSQGIQFRRSHYQRKRMKGWGAAKCTGHISSTIVTNVLTKECSKTKLSQYPVVLDGGFQ